jgi:hypothetical protein
LSSKAQTRSRYTQKDTEAVKKNINLTIKEEMPKNSAIPPHTPYNTLSIDDFLNFCDIKIPPHSHSLLIRMKLQKVTIPIIELN